jgi:hypothetical protein
MEGFPMVWILATACLIGFCISYYIGALGLVLLAFLAVFAALLIGWWVNLPFWSNIGTAFLVSAALQLSYLLGLLSATIWRRVTAFIQMKQERAHAAVAEAGLSKMPEGNAP